MGTCAAVSSAYPPASSTGKAEHFNVTNRIRFGARMPSASQLEDGNRQVHVGDDGPLLCRHLVITVGNNNQPNVPDWSNKLTNVTPLHSKVYKNADHLGGKRVLVVGGGEAASDITLAVPKVASKCWVGLRRSTGWVTPRNRGTRAANTATHREVCALPRSYGANFCKQILAHDKAAMIKYSVLWCA